MEEFSKESITSITAIAEKAVGDLIYTIVFDLSNEITNTTDVPAEKVLEAASSVVNKYITGGIRIRKKPVPRAKTERVPAKEKQVDTLTAAQRKINNLSNAFVWVVHPEDEKYSYSTSAKLASGYPVRDNITHKVVMVATENECIDLTVKDAKVALSLGLDVDFSKVVHN